MTEHDGSFDLLGLDFAPAKPASESAAATVEKPKELDEIRYPSAYDGAAPSSSPSFRANGEEVPAAELGLKRYLVRCEGRWRVRSAPSLNSKVIGTIANGTIVVGEDCSGEILTEAPLDLQLSELMQQDSSLSPEALNKALESLTTLWVKVTRFEAQEPVGVSDIRRDSATGGGIYCLRRNAVGYGLYQEDTEPQKGALIHLPQALALELRLDAQRAATERNEDVSLTWKLLGAAESFGRFFSSTEEAGFSEDIKTPSSRRKPEDLFELKQREQLKKAMASLRAPLAELVDKATKAGMDENTDLLMALPKDLSRRFARLRGSILGATKNANALVVRSPDPGEDVEEATSLPRAVDGSIKELSSFIACSEALERSGAWSCLDTKNRQEVIAFSSSHATDIQKHVRISCKGMKEDATQPSTPSAPGLIDLLETKPPRGYAAPSTTSSVPPLLPPPPRSSCSARRPGR